MFKNWLREKIMKEIEGRGEGERKGKRRLTISLIPLFDC